MYIKMFESNWMHTVRNQATIEYMDYAHLQTEVATKVATHEYLTALINR